MKNLILLLLCAASICFAGEASAQKNESSRKTITKTFSLDGFDGISSSAGIDVYIETGPAYDVKAVTNLRSSDNLNIRVKGRTLHIGYKNFVKTFRARTSVYVTMPEVRPLEASSGSDIKVKGVITGHVLTISASSAADIEASVRYASVGISCSSGADVELKGEADECNASCSSGADIDIRAMKCRRVHASASSGADMEVYATEYIDASASSGADIYYWGDPGFVNANASSGGEIRKK